MCENLSVTDSFMETSLLRTPLYCKYPSIADISDMDMSLLPTPLSLYCKHPLIADISGMEIVFIMDTSHIYLSITDSIMDTFVVRTSPN